MKLVNMDLGIDIDIEENDIYELIIEHEDSFSKAVGSLVKQIEGEDGDFIISANNKPLKVEKQADVIIDFVSLSTNSRKIINKLYSSLDKTAEGYVLEKAAINSEIIRLLEKLTISLGYGELDYNLTFEWNDIFKAYNVRFIEEYTSILDRLVSYFKVISELTDINIVFLVNVKSYLNLSDIAKLYQMIKYYKVNVVLLESMERSWDNHEKRYIIDKDRCFIDVN